MKEIVINDAGGFEVHIESEQWQALREAGRKSSPAIILEYALETLKGYFPDEEMTGRFPVEQAINQTIDELDLMPWFDWVEFVEQAHAAETDDEIYNVQSKYIGINAGVLGKDVYMNMPTQQLDAPQSKHKVFADIQAYIDELKAQEAVQ